VNNEFGSMWKELVMMYYNVYPSIYIDGVRKTTRASQDSWGFPNKNHEFQPHSYCFMTFNEGPY
jgi:hypothetical protein